MDQMANYVPSGWKLDLTHFIGCCWEAQIGSLERDEWCVAITKFLAVMTKKKNREWTDIKELTPLQFMPYMAKLFREVTGRDLSGLGHFMDQPRGLLPLEGSPAGPDPSRPSPRRVARS